MSCLWKCFGIQRQPLTRGEWFLETVTLNEDSAEIYAEELLLLSFPLDSAWLPCGALSMTDGKRLLGFLPLRVEPGMSNYYRVCSNCWSSELANTTP